MTAETVLQRCIHGPVLLSYQVDEVLQLQGECESQSARLKESSRDLSALKEREMNDKAESSAQVLLSAIREGVSHDNPRSLPTGSEHPKCSAAGAAHEREDRQAEAGARKQAGNAMSTPL